MTVNSGRGDPPETELRFGLVGAGRWGRCHASAIAQTPGATLAAVATSSPDSAKRLADELGVVGYPSWQAMMADRHELALDVVDVVAPNVLHGRIALAALEAGLHVLVEKPMATTLHECRALLAAAAASGKTLAVGHELRLSSLWRTVKLAVDEGRIGEPRAMTASLFRRSFRAGSGGWRHRPESVGNWLLEEPIHFLDLARWYFSGVGDPVSVYAVANGKDADLQENVLAVLEFDGGGYASLAQTLAGAEHHVVAELVGTQGALRVTWSGESDRSRAPRYGITLASHDVAEDLALTDTPSEEQALQLEIRDLVTSLGTGHRVAAAADDGYWAVMLALAASESAATRRRVPLPMP